eukprot:scpid78432/ scgid28160/ 
MDSAKAKLGMGRQKPATDGSPRPPKRTRFPADDDDVIFDDDVKDDDVKDVDSPPSTLLLGASPLPDAELERYVTWCINRIATSEKIVIEQQGKLDKLQIQSTSQVFEQYILNKFSKMSDKARLHECTEYVDTGIASCKQKIDRANTITNEAKRDMDDVVTTLLDDKQGADFASMILYRFDYLQSLKCATNIVKNLRLSKIAERKTPKQPVKPMDVTALPPTTEEIGTLIKKEVARQVKGNAVQQKKTIPNQPKPTKPKSTKTKNFVVKASSGRRKVSPPKGRSR